MKLRVFKTLLWFLAGLALTVVVARIINGPGSVTNLTDILPWGLWKGGGVVSLVAIGGAGFTVAMFVFIFGWQRYHPVVRGAVMLGLLCYTSVAIGLTFDIGIWWRIVFPVWHWQFHSVLFEVAWCIMLYLVVLALEFSHTLLERFEMHRALGVLKRFTLIFVVAGIGLSTLHQSSLGTLFLATPFRLYPLWHTDLLPVLFFISSMAIGCLTISLVTLFVYWLYDTEPPMHAITGLAHISVYLLIVYVALRFLQILVGGEANLLVQPTWDTFNFWVEIGLSAVIPIALLSRRELRESKTAVFWIALVATAGITLNRVNVAGLATTSLTRSFYFPAWTEWVLTFGILAAGGLVLCFAAEHLGLFEGISKDRTKPQYRPGHLDHTDWAALYFGAQRFGEARVYSLAFVIALAVSFGLLHHDAIYGVAPVSTPTEAAREISAQKVLPTSVDSGTVFKIGNAPASADSVVQAYVLMIDGNRNGDYVLFDHDKHAERAADGRDLESSCVACHHMAKPFDRATECYECHSDMYLTVDIFDHELHVGELGGNQGCVECHTDPRVPKTRGNSTDCVDCHEGMRREGSRVQVAEIDEQDLAVGYMHAMHELCITCHEEYQPSLDLPNENFSRCAQCHQALPPHDSDVWKKTGMSTANYAAPTRSRGGR
jgi:Ni/Fe-hydrogenase subunit HybB-like protein